MSTQHHKMYRLKISLSFLLRKKPIGYLTSILFTFKRQLKPWIPVFR